MMKKLFTLSAVAMTGATLGMGSAFGWWQDAESEAQSPAAPVGDRSSDEKVSEDKEAVTESPEARREHADDAAKRGLERQSVIVRGHRTRHDNEALRRLAHDLENQIDELQRQGLTEAAQTQRQILTRLVELMRSREASDPIRGAEEKMLDATDRHLPHPMRERIARMEEMLRRTDHPERRRELERVIDELKHQRPDERAAHREEVELPRRDIEHRIENRPGTQTDDRRQLSRTLLHHAELKSLIEQLQNRGFHGKANELREQLELMTRERDHSPEELNRDELVARHSQAAEQAARAAEAKVHELRERQARLAQEVQERLRQDMELANRKAAIARERAELLRGAPLHDVHHLLHELRQEVKALRTEVRELRELLGDRPKSAEQDAEGREEDSSTSPTATGHKPELDDSAEDRAEDHEEEADVEVEAQPAPEAREAERAEDAAAAEEEEEEEEVAKHRNDDSDSTDAAEDSEESKPESEPDAESGSDADANDD